LVNLAVDMIIAEYFKGLLESVKKNPGRRENERDCK
jgi:hypothetical protein